jgi:hypothetical protein
MNFIDYLWEKSLDVTDGVIMGIGARVSLSYELTVITNGVFPYSVGISFRVKDLSNYVDSLSSLKRLSITESILEEL